MTENSDNSEQLPKNQEELPAPPEELPKKPNVAEEAAAPVPKAKGRPRGSRDSAPRVRRVPVVAPAPKQSCVRPASRPPRQVRVREPEPDSEGSAVSDEASPLPVAAPLPIPEPPKSPRALRRERMQALSEHRRAAQQAQQARFDRLLDGFMGY